MTQMIHTLYASLDLEAVYQAVVDQVGDYLRADRCFISRFEPSRGELCAPTREYRSSPAVKSIIEEAPVTLWGSLSEYANGLCLVQEPVDYHDIYHRVSPESQLELERLQVHSGIAVALRFQTCLGILFVQSMEEERVWSQQEKQLLNLVAHQVSAVTHHADLYKQLEDRAIRRRLLNRLYQKALIGLEPNKLFNLALDQLKESLGIPVCKVIQFLPKPNPTQPLRIQAVLGLPASLIGQSFDVGLEPHAAYTLEAKEPIVVSNIYQETRFQPSPLHREYGLVSGVAVVIWGAQQPYGILEIDDHKERHFPIEDIQFLEAIANLLGTVLERKRMETLTYQSEQQFKLMVQGLKDYAVAWLTPEGIIESWNLAAEMIFGYSAQEMIGQSCNLLYSEADLLQQAPQRLLRMAAQQGKITQEGFKRCRSGAMIPCETTITALFENEKQLLGYVAIAQDISARKKAEDALRASEERYRSLVEGSTDYAIYLEDSQGYITSWNRGAQHIFGYSASEIEGQHFSCLLTAEDIQNGLPERRLRIATETGRFETEGWRVRKDGSQFWASIVVNALYNEGNVVGFTTIIRDQTQKQLSNQALVESQARYDRVISGSDEGFWDWDVPHDSLYWSDRVYQMLGIRKSNTPGSYASFERFLHPEDKSRVWLAIEKTLQEGVPFNEEFRIRHSSGEYRHFYSRARPYYDEQGKLSLVSGMVADITERKQTELALAVALEHLRASNRDLEQFAAIASHDLKAPLRKVKMFSTMLTEQAVKKLEPEEVDLFQRMNQSIDSMQQLINDLLELSQISLGNPTLQRVDLKPVIRQVCMNLEEKIQSTQAEIEIGPLGTVYGNEVQLIQLLQNLVENAIKYQPPGNHPKISIQSDCLDEQTCTIRVSDNGIGIDPEQAERIFKPFERLHGKSSIYSGNGIGLAICKRIVERHHGRIDVISQPGQGSTFLIQLPKLNQTERSGQPANQASSGTEQVEKIK